MLSVPFLNKSFEIKGLVRKGTDNKKELIRGKEKDYRHRQRPPHHAHAESEDYTESRGI